MKRLIREDYERRNEIVEKAIEVIEDNADNEIIETGWIMDSDWRNTSSIKDIIYSCNFNAPIAFSSGNYYGNATRKAVEEMVSELDDVDDIFELYDQEIQMGDGYRWSVNFKFDYGEYPDYPEDGYVLYADFIDGNGNKHISDNTAFITMNDDEDTIEKKVSRFMDNLKFSDKDKLKESKKIVRESDEEYEKKQYIRNNKSDIYAALEDAYGFNKKECADYIKKASLERLKALTDGFKDTAKKSFYTDSKIKNGKIVKESIDLNDEQTIKITDEMKEKYPALSNYDEMMVSGRTMNWYDADKYAKNNKAVLPDFNEAENIIDLIQKNNYNKYFEMWTRKVDTYYETAYFYNTRKDFFIEDKDDYDSFCICLRSNNLRESKTIKEAAKVPSSAKKKGNDLIKGIEELYRISETKPTDWLTMYDENDWSFLIKDFKFNEKSMMFTWKEKKDSTRADNSVSNEKEKFINNGEFDFYGEYNDFVNYWNKLVRKTKKYYEMDSTELDRKLGYDVDEEEIKESKRVVKESESDEEYRERTFRDNLQNIYDFASMAEEKLPKAIEYLGRSVVDYRNYSEDEYDEEFVKLNKRIWDLYMRLRKESRELYNINVDMDKYISKFDKR